MPGAAAVDMVPPNAIAFSTPNGTLGIIVDTIVCCESAGKNALVRCADAAKPHLVFHSLADIEARLGAYQCFARIHRSKLLNLAYCKGWKQKGKEAIALIALGGTEEECSVSRTNKAAFVAAWKEYISKKRPNR